MATRARLAATIITLATMSISDIATARIDDTALPIRDMYPQS
jgi:hypothetical protein